MRKEDWGAGVTGMTGVTGMIWMTEIKPCGHHNGIASMTWITRMTRKSRVTERQW